VREAAWHARAALARIDGLTIAPDDALRIATEAAVAMQKESHADVRAAAARAAGAFGEAGVASSLVDALLTEHLALRRSAEEALLLVASRTDGVAIARGLYGVAGGEMDADPAVRDAALRVLGAARQRDAVPVLESALASPDPRTALAAVEGLARHGSRAALVALGPWVESHPDQQGWIDSLSPEQGRSR
jgi:HEAT repeat protein